ncbi:MULTISPECIES: type II toxin-antitoxin system RelE/ParE family toxin [unclassified Empedobacter]|uniref:type II toxin-antitoxin system RelE/ParE family toxin n=1 Tax=unclassified Empedobacter TaxID=2643773 RepID=UPI0024483792|nr:MULTISPECIES: type II toxin-antitoxin system RelE/ParE family toxin [unclassified Empedobacter]MDH2207522.1 type II toxin-antitoxin system RelE/ParE family toxin [Empedobacter sp. GD03644]
MRLEFLPKLPQDIEQAISYYSNFSTSAAKSYLTELTKVLEALEINPFYQVKYRNLRAKPFKSFPYLVLFETNEEEKTVFIYAIFNTHRNPTKYPK